MEPLDWPQPLINTYKSTYSKDKMNKDKNEIWMNWLSDYDPELTRKAFLSLLSTEEYAFGLPKIKAAITELYRRDGRPMPGEKPPVPKPDYGDHDPDWTWFRACKEQDTELKKGNIDVDTWHDRICEIQRKAGVYNFKGNPEGLMELRDRKRVASKDTAWPESRREAPVKTMQNEIDQSVYGVKEDDENALF